MRASLDGRAGFSVLMNTSTSNPMHIAIDYVNERIYWTIGVEIGFISENGQNRQILTSTTFLSDFISVLDVRTLLVNSYGSGVVRTIDVSGAINVTSSNILTRFCYGLAGSKIISAQSQAVEGTK